MMCDEREERQGGKLFSTLPTRSPCPSLVCIMIKTCALLAVAVGAATASPWAGQPSTKAAFVGAPVGRASPWGLGTRWLSSPTSTAARVGAVSRNAVARLDALSMKLGEDEKVSVVRVHKSAFRFCMRTR